MSVGGGLVGIRHEWEGHTRNKVISVLLLQT